LKSPRIMEAVPHSPASFSAGLFASEADAGLVRLEAHCEHAAFQLLGYLRGAAPAR
jgi:hypothetical protein